MQEHWKAGRDAGRLEGWREAGRWEGWEGCRKIGRMEGCRKIGRLEGMQEHWKAGTDAGRLVGWKGWRNEGKAGRDAEMKERQGERKEIGEIRKLVRNECR